mgnify:CR=1 FL=1
MGTFSVLIIFLIFALFIYFTGEFVLPLLIPLFLISIVCIFVYSCATDNNTNVNLSEGGYSEPNDDYELDEQQRREEEIQEIEDDNYYEERYAE